MSWGSRSFGSRAFGGAIVGMALTVGLSGVAATGSVGTIGASLSTSISQNSATGSVGTVGAGLSRLLSQNNGAGSVGTVGASLSASLGQNSATGSVGSVANSVTGGECIISITGNAATGSVSTVAVSVTGGTCALNINGNAGAGSVGTIRTALNSVSPSVVQASGTYYTYPAYPTSPLTFSFDGTGCNYLVVLISASYIYPDPTFTGVTFNGVALTNRASVDNNDVYCPKSEIWTLASPASGIHDLVISWTGYTAWGFDATALGLTNVTAIDQTVTQSYTSGSDRPITVNSTVYDTCLAILTMAYGNPIPYANQNEPGGHTDDGLFLRHRVAGKQGQDTSTTLGWTEDTPYSTTMAAISLTGVGPAQSTIALTGNIATGSLGAIVPENDGAITGVSGTGSVGTVTATIVYGAILTGNTATGSVGTVSATTSGNAAAALTGNAASGSVGSVSNSLTCFPTQNVGTGSVGSVGFSLGGSIALTGNTATVTVGTVTETSTVALLSAAGTGLVGSFGISNSCTLALTGLQAFGLVGNVTPPVRLIEGSWQRASGHKTRSD